MPYTSCDIYARTVVSPFPTARTTPCASTTATSVSADSYRMVSSKHPSGASSAFSAIFLPSPKTTLFLSSMTSFAASLTVTIEVEENVCLSYSTVTVIFAVPTETVVTTPSDTVATALLSVFHETEVYAAPSGFTENCSVSVFPTPSANAAGEHSTYVGFMTGPSSLYTVTVQVSENVLSSYVMVAVIFAVPTDTAVTTPFDTVATALLSVFHEAEVYATPLGFTFNVSVNFSPGVSRNPSFDYSTHSMLLGSSVFCGCSFVHATKTVASRHNKHNTPHTNTFLLFLSIFPSSLRTVFVLV